MFESAKAVFLSYASQDAEAAKRICETLRAAGVEVWFDQDALVGGDAWDQKIRGQINSCALFIPVVSAATQERLEGYFRIEWKLAAERTHAMAAARPFLLPVVIDATRDAEAHVPVEFRAVHWTKLPSGETTSAFVTRVQKLLSGPAAPVAAAAPAALPVSAPAPAAGSGLPHWVGVALGVVVLALFGYVISRPGAIDTAPAPKSAAQAKTASEAVPAPLPLPDDKSIAVLPFTNLSDDKENTAFFSDGMHEDLLTTLANIPELRVISRTSVLEYRGTTKKISQIARELGVAYILEGSVRRAGNQIRLSGKLFRAAKDEQLWGRFYDKDLTARNVFAIQAELATEIAGALQAAISPATKILVERRPTENGTAYDLYLQARELKGGSQGAMADRVKLLQQAVELDPNFAEAWGDLAAAHSFFVVASFDRTPERLAQADRAIARAVLLAPDTPEVMLAYGAYARNAHLDFARSAGQLEKVIQLQPNNAEAYYQLGWTRRRQGRWSESLASFRKAAEIDSGYLGSLRGQLHSLRRWDEGLAVHRRLIALREDASAPRRFDLARFSFAATGSTREFDDLAAQLTPAERASSAFSSSLKEWALIKGDFVAWKRLDALIPLESLNRRSPYEALQSALVYAAHGDMAAARARLESQVAIVRASLEREPANARQWNQLARMEALLGEKGAALRALSRATEHDSITADSDADKRGNFNRAVICALTGDKAQAVAELAEALRFPSSGSFQSLENFPLSVHTLRVDPAFANLRGDPAFEALLKDPKNHAPVF